ncbi:hypothetical protein SeMB42_g06954 [Synchytrium endobioticum]|uniref:Uncharacterized protein n=1 Tax=Synchytrium endobioticum TaxID=286115 RepID=A0A507D9B5_9FUNG|nr:hypothetical protein SeMB42_g06954 [Synchytrium endobioticum]TPX47977.1 hypothetical protein SeLEV6574_g02330 [Synchytrium endobioticum]
MGATIRTLMTAQVSECLCRPSILATAFCRDDNLVKPKSRRRGGGTSHPPHMTGYPEKLGILHLKRYQIEELQLPSLEENPDLQQYLQPSTDTSLEAIPYLEVCRAFVCDTCGFISQVERRVTRPSQRHKCAGQNAIKCLASKTSSEQRQFLVTKSSLPAALVPRSAPTITEYNEGSDVNDGPSRMAQQVNHTHHITELYESIFGRHDATITQDIVSKAVAAPEATEPIEHNEESMEDVDPNMITCTEEVMRQLWMVTFNDDMDVIRCMRHPIIAFIVMESFNHVKRAWLEPGKITQIMVALMRMNQTAIGLSLCRSLESRTPPDETIPLYTDPSASNPLNVITNLYKPIQFARSCQMVIG